MHPRAESRLRRGALLSKIGEKENLAVPDTKIDDEISRMVNEAGPRGQDIRRHFSDPQHRQLIQRTLFTRMALDKLVLIAQGKEPDGVEAKDDVKGKD